MVSTATAQGRNSHAVDELIFDLYRKSVEQNPRPNVRVGVGDVRGCDNKTPINSRIGRPGNLGWRLRVRFMR
jgi:hypothetical protein